MVLSSYLGVSRQILIVQNRWWDFFVHSMSRDSIVHSEDSANQFVLTPCKGCALSPYDSFYETRPFRRRGQLTGKLHSQLTIQLPATSCTQVAPSHLISQDRAHNVIRLHWKYSKHGRHSNLFVPGWPSRVAFWTHILSTRHVSQNPPTSPPLIKPIHPGVSF
jgi:hypothetical protein